MVKSKGLDPFDFIAAPRRSGATPNPAGTHAIYTISTYSFESHTNNTGTHVLDFGTGISSVISKDAQSKNYAWTGFGSEVLWQKQVNGITEFWIQDAAIPEARPYQAGRIEASVSILKVCRLTDESFAIIVLGPTDAKLAATPVTTYSTGREYTSLPVNGFNGYITTSDRQVLWYLRFDTSPNHDVESEVQQKFILGLQVVDILKETGLNFVPSSGVIPNGPMNCDLSSTGLAFVANLPEEYPQRSWTSELFIIPIQDLNALQNSTAIIKPQKVNVKGASGAASLPIFSSDGNSVAFLKSEDQNKVISKNHVFVTTLAHISSSSFEIILRGSKEKLWPLNPEMLIWSNDNTKLFISAQETGSQRLFQAAATEVEVNIPKTLVRDGSISNVYPYSRLPSDTRLLVSKTSYVDSSIFGILEPSTHTFSIISILTTFKDFGLTEGQISEIWYNGHGDYDVHAWIVKPSYFKEGEIYPFALLIHGGPASSWLNSWSTRWNPVVFAEQGYIIVLPDITGSTGYGEDFTEAAILDFGGRPYYDLEKCFEYVAEHVEFADATNAVALGGSYGGYLINWLAGKPLGKKFKALVSHDGIFNSSSLYASDVPSIWKVLFGGYDSDPGSVTQIFKKWDPAQYSDNWTTPMLLIHSDLDRRCPASMGLAAFTTLQMKGVESKFLSFPDEGHFVLKPENSLQWHRTVIAWINKFTSKGDAQELKK